MKVPNTTKQQYHKLDTYPQAEKPKEKRQSTRSANRQKWGQRQSQSPVNKVIGIQGSYGQRGGGILETEAEEESYSPNIFNMKNQVIREASYNEEYTARESAIKKHLEDFDDGEEDHARYDSDGNII